jgi:hypothetical protein
MLCIFTRQSTYEIFILSIFSQTAPVAFWGILWVMTGLTLMVGSFDRKPRLIEYGALASAAIWVIVSWNAIAAWTAHPMTSAVSPIIALFSVVIFWYQAGVNKKVKDGRLGNTNTFCK